MGDKSLTQEGKSLIGELKNNEKSEVSGILQDGEQLIKELKKNEEVNSLLKEGKSVVMDILTNKGLFLSQPNSNNNRRGWRRQASAEPERNTRKGTTTAQNSHPK